MNGKAAIPYPSSRDTYNIHWFDEYSVMGGTLKIPPSFQRAITGAHCKSNIIIVSLSDFAMLLYIGFPLTRHVKMHSNIDLAQYIKVQLAYVENRANFLSFHYHFVPQQNLLTTPETSRIMSKKSSCRLLASASFCFSLRDLVGKVSLTQSLAHGQSAQGLPAIALGATTPH